MEELSKALREEMTRRGHSLRQAAEAMGVSATSVSNWLRGWIVTNPDKEHLVALAEYLGVPFYVVLGYFDWLSQPQVDLLSTIPGSLRYLDGLALAWAEERGYLNRLPFEPLTVAG